MEAEQPLPSEFAFISGTLIPTKDIYYVEPLFIEPVRKLGTESFVATGGVRRISHLTVAGLRQSGSQRFYTGSHYFELRHMRRIRPIRSLGIVVRIRFQLFKVEIIVSV